MRAHDALSGCRLLRGAAPALAPAGSLGWGSLPGEQPLGRHALRALGRRQRPELLLRAAAARCHRDGRGLVELQLAPQRVGCPARRGTVGLLQSIVSATRQTPCERPVLLLPLLTEPRAVAPPLSSGCLSGTGSGVFTGTGVPAGF